MTFHELPETGPGPDLRAGAWLGAWDRIEAAQKLKTAGKLDGLPEIYWATLAEADVLARLATADEDPGRDAGRHVVNRDQRAERDRARITDALSRKTKPNTPAAGDRVRVIRGDWAGRHGQIAKTYPDNHPPMIDVELDPPGRPDDPDEPVAITVLPSQVIVVDVRVHDHALGAL